jgi:hypothetical protein
VQKRNVTANKQKREETASVGFKRLQKWSFRDERYKKFLFQGSKTSLHGSLSPKKLNGWDDTIDRLRGMYFPRISLKPTKKSKMEPKSISEMSKNSPKRVTRTKCHVLVKDNLIALRLPKEKIDEGNNLANYTKHYRWVGKLRCFVNSWKLLCSLPKVVWPDVYDILVRVEAAFDIPQSKNRWKFSSFQ